MTAPYQQASAFARAVNTQYYFGRVGVEPSTKGVWLLFPLLRTMRVPAFDQGQMISRSG